jgi:tetratricopeptide (TPR) repeat protein
MQTRIVKSTLLIVAGICAVFGTTALAGTPTPERPEERFYFLNVDGPGPDTGKFDERLKPVAEAFGDGQFGRCRELATALLRSMREPGLRNEAQAYVVESYLAEGNFRAALAAAEKADDETLTPYVSDTALLHEQQLSHLQQALAASDDPAHVLHLRYCIGHVQQAFGQREPAIEAYGAVIGAAPEGAYAGAAVRQIANILTLYDPSSAALERLDAIVGSHPGSYAERALAAVYSELGRKEFRRGKRARAVAAWERACSLEPDAERRARTVLSLGESLINLARYDEAHAWLQPLREDASPGLAEWRKTAEYLDAVAYVRSGDSGMAAPILELIVGAPGKHPYRDAAQSLLERMPPASEE